MFNSFALALQNTTPFSYDHYRQIHYAKESIRSINKFPVLLEKEVKSKIQELPILVLSPGPSLRENFKWLKKNQDKFITIAFGATVKALCEVGVKPDIITSVDASTLILRQFPKECKKVYENSLALIATDSHRDLFKFFKKENITVFEPNFKIVKEGLRESPALTVGDNCIHILLTMGFKEIYLLGTDLAIDLDTGNSYDKTHLMSGNKRNLHYLNKNIKKISEEVDVSSNYIAVESNFGDKTLYADQFFLKLLESYKTIIKEHKKKYDFNIYNLSSGSRIDNTTPLEPRDISLPKIENQKEIKELKKFLIQKSRTHSSEDEKEYIIHEIDFLNKLLMNIKNIKNTDLENFEQFYSLRKEYAQKIAKHKSYSSHTRTLLSNYIKIIDSFINFVFNDKNSDYSKKTLQVLKMEWCLQVSELIKEYRKVLKKFKF
ncbi:MAG: motility associated factor glycosyltransferase family protein [Campylobacteraceae bacterium]|nr:motility associated factor glycosyltransferase family protein [Campylobacteraceae bacterium]